MLPRLGSETTPMATMTLRFVPLAWLNLCFIVLFYKSEIEFTRYCSCCCCVVLSRLRFVIVSVCGCLQLKLIGMCSIISDKGLAATLTSDDGCHRLLLHGPISTSPHQDRDRQRRKQSSRSVPASSECRVSDAIHSNTPIWWRFPHPNMTQRTSELNIPSLSRSIQSTVKSNLLYNTRKPFKSSYLIKTFLIRYNLLIIPL